MDPGAPRGDVWAPSMERHARSGYAPAYAPVFLPMASRLLVFTRGDRALLGATYQLPADTTYRTRNELRWPHSPPPALEGWPLRAGFLLDEVGDSIFHASVADGLSEGVLLLEVPAGPYQASVEVLDPSAGIAGRYRNGIRIEEMSPDLPVLSDLLLVHGDSLPAGTLEALARLRIQNRIRPEPSAPGLLERFRRLFGGQSRLPILEWEEPGPEEPGARFQSVSVDPPDLEPGEYRLRLEAQLPGRNLMVRQVVFQVNAGGPGP